MRTFDLYLVQGFVLKTKIAGWKVFCQRLSIPPFVLWDILPGFERLRRALDLLEHNEFRPGPAFQPEGPVAPRASSNTSICRPVSRQY